MGALVMPTSVVLIAGAPRPAAGKRLVDCLLSAESERLLAVSAAHMPLREDTVAPAPVPAVSDLRAMSIDYGAVAETMESMQPWLREWAGL